MTLRADGGPQLGGPNTWTGTQTFADVVIGASNTLSWSTRSKVSSPADGVILLTDTAGAAFTAVKLGGVTPSYPMIKRVGAALEFKLADDSGYAAMQGSQFQAATFICTGNFFGSGDVRAGATNSVYWTGRAVLQSSADGIIAVLNNLATSGAAIDFLERTAPSAPAANTARLYADDSGGGKTRLMVLFPSGAAQQISIEP